MGVVKRIRNAVMRSDGVDARPGVAVFRIVPNVIHSPVTGTVVSLEEAKGGAADQESLGRGVGIVPLSGVVYAPVTGRVSVTVPTSHVIGMTMEGGIGILIHVGMGTSAMDGKGFLRLVEEGQEVAAGTPLLTFDVGAIRAAGCYEVVTCVVTGDPTLRKVRAIARSGTLIGGRPLVKVGDPLLKVMAE